MLNNSTYRIRTNLGDSKPINIPVNLTQEYNSFEILSLKVNMDDTYRSYTSTEGIVVGRVSTANNGLGIPNVRVSIFVPRGAYEQSDEEAVMYPFSSPTDLDGNRVRYNLLPSDSDVDCYQVIGTFPTKRQILDNETVCEVFDKFYKYTTVTNEAGDFMLSNIPVGKQRLHIDADLSDIGPFLSQKPYDMIENLGFDKNKFESTRQFKTSADIDSLVQVISQNKSVYVYPYWGDATEKGSEMKITRTDLSLNYEFKTSAVFMGSVVTDRGANTINENCVASINNGKMSDLITGSGRIEMIRKTINGDIEQYRVKGDELIDENGVWCYSVPMNLDYVRTDEFGNIIPTDDPNKGVPTRARVRFRVTLREMESDNASAKRCSYLIPNNPNSDSEYIKKAKEPDYSFGHNTSDESFVDLLINNVYSVKNYIPRIQKRFGVESRRHTGIKMVNHSGDNNPFPYNTLTIRMSFIYRVICVIIDMFMGLVWFLNTLISAMSITFGLIRDLFKSIYDIRPFPWPLRSVRPFFFFKPLVDLFDALIFECVGISEKFCTVEGQSPHKVYPGCISYSWTKTEKSCKSDSRNAEEPYKCDSDDEWLNDCYENMLAQENEVTSFNFVNDWINGCLYMPLWYRKIKPKKSFFFGLFKRRAKDQWCSANTNLGTKVSFFSVFPNRKAINGKSYKGDSVKYYIPSNADGCGTKCHEGHNEAYVGNGIIVDKETMFKNSDGTTAKVWYYKPLEIVESNKHGLLTEYTINDVGFTSVTLFATDIIMIGSMVDCNENGIPKFFNYLSSTTYNMPADLVQLESVFGENSSQDITISTGADWGIENEYGHGGEDDENNSNSGLFYSIGCAEQLTTMASAINLRRVCEIGVDLDNMKYVENLDGASETEELDYMDERYYLRPDGYISYDDIIDFNYRSMFATMNGNSLKTKIDTTNGVKKYEFIPLYVDNFDGSLRYAMEKSLSGKGDANYQNNFKLEETSIDYLTFRLGDKPYYYNDTHSMAKYNNSFYFYFGLKEGNTAIELFNEKYNAKCYTNTILEKTLDYTATGSDWCRIAPNGLLTDVALNGKLSINLDKIARPCTIILNSTSVGDLSYTIVNDEYGNNTEISDEKVILNGDNDTITQKRHYARRETSNGNSVVRMVENGDYNVIIMDADGNYDTYQISVKTPKLSKETLITPFKCDNLTLEKRYGNDWYASASKGDIRLTIHSGIPSVLRVDGNFKVNGTLCIYNLSQENNVLNESDVLIEVESETKDVNGRPRFAFSVYEGKLCSVGKYKMITKSGDTSQYTFYDDSKGVYVIKFPRGGENYRVVISQVCQFTYRENDGGVERQGFFKTNNSQTQNVYVSEALPYKLYINNIDYDIIKNFKTGWELSTDKELQYNNPEGIKPFVSVGNVTNIRGWDDIGNINNPFYLWSEDIDKYGNFNSNDAEKYKNWFKIKLEREPKEDDDFFVNSGANFNDYYYYWNYGYADNQSLNDIRIGEKIKITYDDNGKSTCEIDENGYDLGGSCGYQQLIKGDGQKYKNRLKFVEKMKEAFWIQEENGNKNITIKIQTDDNPYDFWVMGNQEMISKKDTYYYENEGNNNGGRDGWIYSGGNSEFKSIHIPNLTSCDSKNYGIDGDTIREKYTTTYNKISGICYAQSNICKESDENGVNIKPPYMVACVNNEGETKPNGLTKGTFYGTSLVGNVFGDSGDNLGYIKNKGVEFFQFMFIDKIFATDCIYWSSFNNIPFFLPNERYNNPKDKRVGKSLTINGLLSGIVRNGSTDRPEDCEDFETKNINGKNMKIITFYTKNGNDRTYLSENTIPTKRCILSETDNMTYQNYRHTNEIDENNQCIEIKRGKHTLELTDKNGKSISKDIYGSFGLKVKVIQNTEHFNHYFVHLSRTMVSVNVSSRNIDSDCKYYLFPSTWEKYPINHFKITENDGEIGFYADFNNDIQPWSIQSPLQIFNRNTTEEDISKMAYQVFADGDVIETEDGEEAREGFDPFLKKAYRHFYIVALNKDGARTISPLYDLSDVEFLCGYFYYNGDYYFRFKIVNLIVDDIMNNYYLCQFSFSAQYEMTLDDNNISSGNFVFNKEMPFKNNDDSIEFEKVTNGETYGYSYKKMLNVGSKIIYGVISVKENSAEFNEPKETDTKPSNFDKLKKLPLKPYITYDDKTNYYEMCGGKPKKINNIEFNSLFKDIKCEVNEEDVEKLGQINVSLNITDVTEITLPANRVDNGDYNKINW